MTRFLQFLQLTGIIVLSIAVFFLHGAIQSINSAKVRDINFLAEKILQLQEGLTSTNASIDETQRRVSDVTGNLYSNLSTLGASLAIESPVALFETSLANPISSSASTMTLNSATTKDGSTLASSTYSFIIDEGTTNEEFVKADCTSTACTNMSRGLSVLTGTTTVSALQKAHRRGASVKITDGPLLLNLTRIINGYGKLPNRITYDGVASSTFTQYDLIDKDYADGLSYAGAPNGSQTVKGIFEAATGAEAAAGTILGATGAELTLTGRISTSTCDSAANSVIVSALSTGKIAAGCIDLTATYTWTGAHIFSSTVTFNATTTATAPTIGFGTFAQMVASTTLTGNATPQPVFVSTTTDALLLSDANDNMASQFVGFAIDSVTNGGTTTVQFSGVVAGFSGLTRGSKYYVQDAVGTIGTSVGTNDILVGTAISATELLIERNPEWEYVGSGTRTTGGDIPGPSIARFAIVFMQKFAGNACDGASSEVSFQTQFTLAKVGATTASHQAAHGCGAGQGPTGSSLLEVTFTSTSSVRVAASTNGSASGGNFTAYFYR